MKLNNNTSEVEISGAVNQPSTFGIAVNGTAFKVLSSHLYANKVRAIIRELSCNARDAHVAAGNKHKPFAIHLPTSFEPFFAIKDYGTGLSDKDVHELYCQYFGSSRNNSNLFVGALGLGSKSPFCYTEGFSVTSRHDGMTRIYSCYIDEQGMPAVLLQTEEATPDAPAGMEISFPVKQDDVWEFENQARYAMEFFNPVPEINVEIEIEHAEYKIKTKLFGLRDDDEPPRAIQGAVQYAIGNIDESRLSQEQQSLIKMPLDLFFPIGELSVAASRESLSNDEATVANILKALNGVQDALLEDVKKKLTACKTLWDAKVLLFSLSNNDHIGDLVSKAAKNGTFNDVNPAFMLDSEKPSILKADYPEISIFEFRASKYRTWASKQHMTDDYTEKVKFDLDEENSVFIVNDIGIGAEKYVQHYLQRDNGSFAYLITRKHKKVPVEYIVEQAAKIIAVVGQPPVLLLSGMKEKYQGVFSTAKPTVPVAPRKILAFNTSNYYEHHEKGWRKAWDNATNDALPAVKYYVKLKNLEPQTGKFAKARDFKTFVQSVQQSGFFNFSDKDAVYGLPFWNESVLDDSWVEFTGYVMDTLVKLMTPEVEQQIAFSESGFSTGFDNELRALVRDKTLTEDSPFQQFCGVFAEMSKKNKYAALLPIIEKAKTLGVYNATATAMDFSEMWRGIQEAYPLLEFLDSYRSRRHGNFIEALVQYVTLVDSTNSAKQDLQMLVASNEEAEGDQYAN